MATYCLEGTHSRKAPRKRDNPQARTLVESTPGDVIARIACGLGSYVEFTSSRAERDVRMLLGC